MFGVKDSLVVQLKKVEDEKLVETYGVEIGTALLTYDFVLVTDEAAADLRRQRAEEAMAKLGRKFEVHNDVHVPGVD